MLKQANWHLTLPLKVAMEQYPELIVSLNESQCLRFIDEINGTSDRTAKVRSIQKTIKQIKKLPKSRENKKLIENNYEYLYNLQFQKDYMCVIMNCKSDYDRANLGFTISFGNGCTIKYKRLLGTNGGIKNSTIVYVNENIYDELKKRIDNGRNKSKEFVPAKLEAYQALVCSGSTPLPLPKGFIVVKDCITKFKEDVYLIDDSEDGEPKLTYEKDYEIEHDDSDGFGLMLPSYSQRVNEYLNGNSNTIAGMNTRFAWTKGMLYTFDFIEFAEKIANNYVVTDVWGQKRDVRDAEVILTESMLKLWDSYDSWEDYYENCMQNHYQFSCAKTTPEELESIRFTNYQFLQSYEFTDDELYELCKPAIDEIKDVIGFDYRKSLAFLAGFGLNDKNVFKGDTESYVKALMIEPKLIDDPFVRRKIYNMIRTRIEMGMRGAFLIDANFAMISGDPYALAQKIFGLKVTGLLKKGEVYHKYWSDKGSLEIVCFRAPMTCHNNIRKMKLNCSDEVNYWYKYIDSVLVYNAWDSSCESMNGADKDGDTNMCTDNPILLKNTKSLPAIICLQKKAVKVIPTEYDIIEANKLAFNDDIGTITNRVTSMFELQAGFDKDSAEYKELEYRIMCGQHYQQCSIDRAKGIVAKPMPPYWFTSRGISENNFSEDEIQFQKKIMASHKPYFMTYVYSNLKTENNKYLRNSNSNAVRRFAKYGIETLQDLENYKSKTVGMEKFLEFYKLLSPVGNNACVVNRIAWLFEKEFCSYLKKLSSLEKNADKCSFDYSILKSDTEYSQSNYDKIYQIYRDYTVLLKSYLIKAHAEKLDKFDNWVEIQKYIHWFQDRCYQVCSNADELNNIVIDICYQSENTKQFAWDVCGDVIIKNLLNRYGGKISYPYCVKENGEFTYFGKKFEMRSINVLEEMNDNT